MAEESKLRLAHRRRSHIQRLLFTWYGDLEREPVPACLRDLISQWESGGVAHTAPPSVSVNELASEQNLRR